MKSRLSAAAILIAGTAALAGCDEAGPRTQVVYANPFGSYNTLLDEALAGRAVRVQTAFAPYESDGALADRYAAILTGTDPTLRFVGDGSTNSDEDAGVRVLLLHDTPNRYTAISACQGKPYDPTPKQERLELLAIVCDDDRRVVEVKGYLPRHDGDMKAEYDALLEQTRGEVIVKEDSTPR
jgi:hypothetical protein